MNAKPARQHRNAEQRARQAHLEASQGAQRVQRAAQDVLRGAAASHAARPRRDRVSASCSSCPVAPCLSSQQRSWGGGAACEHGGHTTRAHALLRTRAGPRGGQPATGKEASSTTGGQAATRGLQRQGGNAAAPVRPRGPAACSARRHATRAARCVRALQRRALLASLPLGGAREAHTLCCSPTPHAPRAGPGAAAAVRPRAAAAAAAVPAAAVPATTAAAVRQPHGRLQGVRCLLAVPRMLAASRCGSRWASGVDAPRRCLPCLLRCRWATGSRGARSGSRASSPTTSRPTSCEQRGQSSFGAHGRGGAPLPPAR